MNQATSLTARVSSVSTVVDDISGGSDALQALAWRLLATPDLMGVDPIMAEIAGQTERVNRGLGLLQHDLPLIDHSASLSSLEAMSAAFVHVRQLLIGPSGVAAAVKLNIRKQQEASTLQRTALKSIHFLALSGDMHSKAANAAQDVALARVGYLARATFLLVGFVSLGVFLAGSLIGGRVRRAILKSEEQQQRLQQELREFAFRDPLTQLPNRLSLRSVLEESLMKARTERTELAVMCVDLDRFKQINDRLGHRVGDLYLMEVSKRMQSRVQGDGVVYRVGGDEFVVLLRGIRLDEIPNVARRVQAAIAEPALIENYPVQGGGSIGIACFPADGKDGETLLKNADVALYQAKNAGRNQFSLFDLQIGQSAEEQRDIQDLLRAALKNDGFTVRYQSQFSTDGRVVCLEALLRLYHPSLGDVSPSRFIPVAEECGLIAPIGDWVLREVARQSVAWQRAGLTPIRVGVNVSALQLAQKDFLALLQRVISESGLDPDLLELEITETAIMSHLEETQKVIVQLRGLGLKVSIDDFGTGYSSLSYLHKLPVDTIKIDQSFIRDLHSPTSTYPLVQAITAAAHAFGLSVVAEGVETSSQLLTLADIGCDRMQGYLFARPLVVADVVTLLRNQTTESFSTSLRALSSAVDGAVPTGVLECA